MSGLSAILFNHGLGGYASGIVEWRTPTYNGLVESVKIPYEVCDVWFHLEHNLVRPPDLWLMPLSAEELKQKWGETSLTRSSYGFCLNCSYLIRYKFLEPKEITKAVLRKTFS
jgi:hypothetical protein